MREQIFALLFTGGPLVVATGVASGRDGVEKALAALDAARPKSPEETKAEAQVRAALVPWVIAEVDEPPVRWTNGLREAMRRAAEAERTRRPGSKASTPRDLDQDHVELRPGTLDPAWRLPKDSLHVEVLLIPRTKGTRPARKAHLFAVPKGTATWLGYSEDAVAVTSRMRIALDDSTDVGTLARSADAASLRTQPAAFAGVAALDGLSTLAAPSGPNTDLRSLIRTFGRLPPGSDTLAWTAGADPTAGTAHVALHVQVPRRTATISRTSWAFEGPERRDEQIA